MLGVGWPDLLFIGLLLMLVVKPEEWPRVARTAGRTLRALRKQAAPVLEEIRSISRSWTEEELPSGAKPRPSSDGREPMPQSFQKGGELPATPPTQNDR
jgi:sec-independent protein translocase protein TatB